MRYFLVMLLLISSITLFAQAMPRGIFQKIQTADGSSLSPTDIFITAYFKERPDEIRTSVSHPKHFKSLQIDTIHQGFYIMLNPAAFKSDWYIGDTLIADITQTSTGASLHYTFEMPEGTRVIWNEDPVMLSHTEPNEVESPKPANNETKITKNLTALKWTYSLKKGFPIPAGFRVAISSDSTFSNASVQYCTYDKAGEYSQTIKQDFLPLKGNTTYYWKIIPTISTDEKIQPSSLRPIIINGKLIKSKSSGDTTMVPVWHFTTEK